MRLEIAPTSHGTVAAPSEPSAIIGCATFGGISRESAAIVTGNDGARPSPHATATAKTGDGPDDGKQRRDRGTDEHQPGEEGGVLEPPGQSGWPPARGPPASPPQNADAAVSHRIVDASAVSRRVYSAIHPPKADSTPE